MVYDRMSRFFPLFALSLLTIVLASCATMTKEECLAADWQIVGQNDGAQGYEAQKRFAGHVEACARVDIVPDQSLWNQGYQKGLLRYCTPLNGLEQGQAGRTYANVCPTDKAAGFIGGYQLGRTAHRLRSEISSLKSSIARNQSQISDIFASVGAMSEADRLSAEYQIRDINRDIADDQDDIAELSAQLALVERDIVDFRRRISAAYN